MGVPDVNARKKIRGLRIMANYLIDNNSGVATGGLKDRSALAYLSWTGFVSQ
ncbi:hypothetical protein HanLR1_Chr03g0077571 [Helianthus annuus]|nr:hypothetical protein HanLR1_Chr03g0077571 [Helianthus annuus]